MTPEFSDSFSDDEKLLLARLARPMPLQARCELAVCVAMDQFAAALDSTRAVLHRPAEMPPATAPAALQARWTERLAELTVAFEQTDELAQALIRSIKVLFALE